MMEVGYDGYQTVMGLTGKSEIKFDLVNWEALGFHEYETGKKLGKKLRKNIRYSFLKYSSFSMR